MQKIHVNKSEATSNLEFNKIFNQEATNNENAIDKFFSTCKEYVKLTQPEIIDRCPDVTRLLLMGYVSAVEEYLRNIICDIINISDTAKELVSEKPIKFSAIDLYDREKLAIGLFDSASFASEKEIKKCTNDYLGVNILPDSSLGIALANYNKVCHLRHCSIHSGGILNAHNARELELGKEFIGTKLTPNSVQLQQIVEICYSFVRAFNQFLFDNQISILVAKKILVGIWREDKDKIERIFSILYSKVDMQNDGDLQIIYKNIIIPPDIKSIAPAEKRNHTIIKDIIEKFNNETEVSEISRELEKLTVDEYEALMKKFLDIDEIYTEKMLLYIFNNSDSSKKKIASIFVYANSKELSSTYDPNNIISLSSQEINLKDIYKMLLSYECSKVQVILTYFGSLHALYDLIKETSKCNDIQLIEVSNNNKIEAILEINGIDEENEPFAIEATYFLCDKCVWEKVC